MRGRWCGGGRRHRARALRIVPKEIGAQERHCPAIIVLFIDGPLGAEVVDKDQPKAEEGEEVKRRTHVREVETTDL